MPPARVTTRLRSRCSRHRHQAELLQHAQPVVNVPLLDDPPTADATHDRPRRRHGPPGRRNGTKIALVGAAPGIESRDQISLGDQDLEVECRSGKVADVAAIS